jgi:hypothetical protein
MPGLSSLFNFDGLLARLNPFRNINYARGIVGLFGDTFMSREEEGNMVPSYFSEASRQPLVAGAAGVASSVHPALGVLSEGVGTGVAATIASANPYIGIASGVGALAKGLINLPGEMRKYNAAKQAAKRQERMDAFYDTGADAFASFKRFQDDYKKNQEAIMEELRASRDILGNLGKNQKKDPLVIEQQKVSDAVQSQQQNEDPVQTYNNLQIQRINSFTINSEPALAPRRQTARHGVADRYRRSSLGNRFFAMV